MTPQNLFDMLMAYPQPTRTEILSDIEEVTRKYEPERVEALLADFADMLFQWQCDETYDRAKWEYDERERLHRAKYDERYSAFEVRLNFAEYALAMGTNEPIEWPEDPEPYEPLPFIPPMPGTIADNIHIPKMYNYAVELLKRKTAHETDTLTDTLYLPSELDSDRARTYFPRAIEKGYMKPTATGYKWQFIGKRGGLARLGYFVERVYCPTNTEELPEQSINTLFGVKRIASAISQLHNAKNPQKWRAEIDSTIFFD